MRVLVFLGLKLAETIVFAAILYLLHLLGEFVYGFEVLHPLERPWWDDILLGAVTIILGLVAIGIIISVGYCLYTVVKYNWQKASEIAERRK